MIITIYGRITLDSTPLKVLAQFSGAAVDQKKLMKKLSVKFEGEAGIDAQGLTKELYTAFFGALCGSSELFERGTILPPGSPLMLLVQCKGARPPGLVGGPVEIFLTPVLKHKSPIKQGDWRE